MATVILTGAGVSAPSGLPTYRGPGGLYDGKTLEHGMTIEEILSVQCLKQYPELTQKYMDKISDAFKDAEPNGLHRAIANFTDTQIFTQNIDDLHEKAGSTVYHLHGTTNNPANPLVLFGMNLDSQIIDSWLQALRLADTIIVVGTSCQFEYLTVPISEAVFIGGSCLYLFDPVETHTLAQWATQHFTNKESFQENLEALCEAQPES